jgi:hypothetical protein
MEYTNDYNKYNNYIKTCEKYDSYIDDDINLYNLKNKLDNLSHKNNDYDYYTGLMDLNRNIDSVFSEISDNLYSKKNYTMEDEKLKNRCNANIAKKQIELYTDFKRTTELNDTIFDTSQNTYSSLVTELADRKDIEASLHKNRLYMYLILVAIIVLLAIFLIIYL